MFAFICAAELNCSGGEEGEGKGRGGEKEEEGRRKGRREWRAWERRGR